MPSSEAAAPRLTQAELKDRLDDIFYLDVATGRAYDRLHDALALAPRPKQEFALHWGKVATRNDMELGYQLIRLAPEALSRLGPVLAEQWVLAALDVCDHRGRDAALVQLRGIEDFFAAAQRRGVGLASIEGRLTRFVQGLAGRPLHIAADSETWTDTRTLFLPAELNTDDAVERYKALVALLWAQTRHGTFALDLDAALAVTADPVRAAAWLALLEMLRLAACLRRELPGLAGALDALEQDLPPALAEARSELARPEAGVADSLSWLSRLMDITPPVAAPLGALRATTAQAVRGERIAKDKVVLHQAIVNLMAALGKTGAGEAESSLALQASGNEAELAIDGEVVALPADAQAAAQSLLQDLGAIPPECLTPAGPGPWSPGGGERGEGPVAATEAPPDAIYDEWDYRRHAYRRQWCQVYLRDLDEGDPAYVAAVRQRHAVAIRQIRRRFEALRGEDRILRRQSDGPEIDLDALVESIADRRGGAEPGANLFSRRQRDERSLATAFMVDMSGSTKGWVNDAEREALVMLCEALETLGDRYAIWGFSGWTRARCELYRIKEFAEAYDDTVRGRIAAIEARDYTRMGPAIRHLTQLLRAEPVRHRLLVTLSDGRPDDFGDEYRGHHGIEDTRQALLEARQFGIRAYCITIDRHGADYLPHMYGPAGYTVLDDVARLPLKLVDIYRRLTASR